VLTQFRDLAEGGNDISPRFGGIIGAAFGAIVSSLIDDAVAPVAGFLHERTDSSNLPSVTGNPNDVPVAAFTGPGRGVSNIGLFTNAVVNSSVSPLVCFSSSRALTV
jgi:large conductance mechanosensitive channel